MRSKDPAFLFVIVIIFLIVYYGKIEEFFERNLPTHFSQLFIKIISHVILLVVIGILSLLYYKFAKNPSLGIIGYAIMGGIVVRVIINELSKLFFNEKFD